MPQRPQDANDDLLLSKTGTAKVCATATAQGLDATEQLRAEGNKGIMHVNRRT